MININNLRDNIFQVYNVVGNSDKQTVKFYKNLNKYIVLSYAIFGFLFWHFAKEMLIVKPDGWYVGQVNLYGDLVYHLSLINKFQVSKSPIIDNPVFAGNKINYPIFPDYITSRLAELTGIDFALFITTFIVGLLCLLSAHLIIKIFTKNTKVLFLAALLFFFNGGLGFIYFLEDYFQKNQSILEFLLRIPNEYTDIKEKGYWWINSYLAYFLPQRSFLFAFPMTLTALSLLYYGWKRNNKFYFLLSAIVSGALPLAQAHSLLLLFILTAFYSTFDILTSKHKKQALINWSIYGLITSIIALPLFNLISSVDSPLSYIKFHFGWSNENDNIFWFWLKNLGIFAPIYILSLFWLFKKRFLFILHLPFVFIFILCNIFIFQPWTFDNSKLLIYWFFSSSVVVAYFLHDVFFSQNLIKKIAGAIIVFFMIFSASIDIFRTFTPVSAYQIYSKIDLEVADYVKTFTPKDAVFINATNHNNPIPTLTGRSSVLGFPGWLWSHGIAYWQREEDVKTIYLGEAQAEKLIAKYKVNFVSIGPTELSTLSINQSYFQKYPKLNAAPGWVLYDVSNIWTNNNR